MPESIPAPPSSSSSRWGFALAFAMLAGVVVAVLRMAGREAEPRPLEGPGPTPTAASTAGPAPTATATSTTGSNGAAASDDLPAGATVPFGYGVLEIAAPPSARVRIDGADAGSGPLSSSVQRAGYHQVRIDQDGKNSQYVIEVRAGKTTRVKSVAAPVRRLAQACLVILGLAPGCSCKRSAEAPPTSAAPGDSAWSEGAAAAPQGRVVMDVAGSLEACTLGHQGVLLDFGNPSMRASLHPGSLTRAEDEIVEHEGATWLRARSRVLTATFTGRPSRATTPRPTLTSRPGSAGCSPTRWRSQSTGGPWAPGRSARARPAP